MLYLFANLLITFVRVTVLFVTSIPPDATVPEATCTPPLLPFSVIVNTSPTATPLGELASRIVMSERASQSFAEFIKLCNPNSGIVNPLPYLAFVIKSNVCSAGLLSDLLSAPVLSILKL